MRQNPNLKLRKLGKHYMIVSTSDNNVNMANVFSLNETAANLWLYIGGREFSVEELVSWLCEEYDVKEEVAYKDIEDILGAWKNYGLVQ